MALALSLLVISPASALPREKVLINNDWTFSYGHAGDRQKDFTHGTEYFTYVTKARSNNGSQAPQMPDFDDSGWQKVSLPHDWVVDLPYSGDASHSHGYKCIGWKYPETSVGWYRKHLFIPEEYRGSRLAVEFEGIFRDSEVFCNGIYMGHERSGYASSVYDITEYIEYGKDNVIAVRADASLEEGWFYEGAGIYRNVYLHRTSQTAVVPYGVQVKEYRFNEDRSRCVIVSDVAVDPLAKDDDVVIVQTLLDPDGRSAGSAFAEKGSSSVELEAVNPILWSADAPYLYTLRTCLYKGDIASENLLDQYDLKIGVRQIEFGPQGFLLNGRRTVFKGCDLHLDQAGVGAAVPDALWRYKLLELKKYGFNAIRSSHNPASPAMLDLCDELGFLVIDENRCLGVNDEHLDLLERMIRRDSHHPSVVLWSIGNEEWAVEYSPTGRNIARRMVDFVHSIDPSRPVTYGNCSGDEMTHEMDVMGYNYVVQNYTEKYHGLHPERAVLATEETSGCGTRGVYATDAKTGAMLSLNRSGVDRDSINGSDDAGIQFNPHGKVLNVIERGWKYAAERPWNAGVCYWTGFDYRGEPNPMSWPATGSQFGILDYCAYPKDEAFYLKSCWVDEPMVYASPDWRARPEGENVDVWIYSNCDEVQLFLNGKPLGRRPMPRYGHISWPVKYKAGKLEARGFVNGKKAASFVVETPDAPASLDVKVSTTSLASDGQDVAVLDLTVLDANGRTVPDACVTLAVNVSDNVTLLGWGNGDPGFKVVERPVPGTKGAFSIKTFSGRAQVLVRSVEGASGQALVSIVGLDCQPVRISYR